jgi:hypothetical protein
MPRHALTPQEAPLMLPLLDIGAELSMSARVVARTTEATSVFGRPGTVASGHA